MKTKTTIITFLLPLFISFSAQAAEDKNDEKFAAHKAEIVSHLTKEKTITETAIGCFNSAADKSDLKKCREQRKLSMKELKKEEKALKAKKSAEKKGEKKKSSKDKAKKK